MLLRRVEVTTQPVGPTLRGGNEHVPSHSYPSMSKPESPPENGPIPGMLKSDRSVPTPVLPSGWMEDVFIAGKSMLKTLGTTSDVPAQEYFMESIGVKQVSFCRIPP